jgi:hypothetical protein
VFPRVNGKGWLEAVMVCDAKPEPNAVTSCCGATDTD